METRHPGSSVAAVENSERCRSLASGFQSSGAAVVTIYEVPQTYLDARCSPRDRDEGEERGLDGSQEKSEQQKMNLLGKKGLLLASNLLPVEIFVFSLRLT